MGNKRVCYVVHWCMLDMPESRIYPDLTPHLTKFIDELRQANPTSGPVLERIVMGDLTNEDKKKLKKMQEVA